MTAVEAAGSALAVMLVTDGRGDAARVEHLVTAAVAGGIRAVQLREPGLCAAELATLCAALRPVLDAVGGVLLVNDRADVVAAGLAHGVHLGHRSLRPEQVRPFVGAALVGCAAHDAGELRAAQAADYVLLSPLFRTASKPDVEPLGLSRAARWIAGSATPVLLLGGIDASNAAAARQIGARGVAVMRAVCDASDPRAAAAELCAAVSNS
ncbi:MAG: thiamine phosphate synthase [Planctomycetes bacterium]|nr:thiamine phosphate synthase [Planctomycetota bacterium]MCB9888506.1 thiamine phosphate synthase [Planctomycetota bacterium]